MEINSDVLLFNPTDSNKSFVHYAVSIIMGRDLRKSVFLRGSIYESSKARTLKRDMRLGRDGRWVYHEESRFAYLNATQLVQIVQGEMGGVAE